MGLNDRLRERGRSSAVVSPLATSEDLPIWAEEKPEFYSALKVTLHHRLVDQLDTKSLESLSAEELRVSLNGVLSSTVSESQMPLNRLERERLIQEVLDEVTGIGPLEPLLRDPTISDILVNTYSSVYIERRGKLELTQVRFRDNDHLKQIINRIVSRVGRRVDETSPMVDARLADGSRVNAIVPPLAVDGPLLSIRRFGGAPLKLRDLLGIGAMTVEMLGFLAACVRAKVNLLVSGGTGAGKTTLLNALSSMIPESERIVTIEDAAELQMQQHHVVRLETRPPNLEGKGEILTRDLVRNSLRMRPDRIVIGEVRGSEVFDMLQAMNTGHEGSMTTVHANNPRDGLTRLESMVGMAGIPLSPAGIRQIVARALQVVVQLARMTDGRRRIVCITEITGIEGDLITTQDLFRFEQTGVDSQGKVLGEFYSTGIRPHVMERIEQFGININSLIQPYLES